MIKIMLILVYIFISIGVFIKLKKYGAPNSSIFYSGIVPFSVLFGSILLLEENLRSLDCSLLKKIKIFILSEKDYMKNISVLTGLVCIELGKRKIGIVQLLRIRILKSGFIKSSYICIKDMIEKFNKMRMMDVNSYSEKKILKRI